MVFVAPALPTNEPGTGPTGRRPSWQWQLRMAYSRALLQARQPAIKHRSPRGCVPYIGNLSQDGNLLQVLKRDLKLCQTSAYESATYWYHVADGRMYGVLSTRTGHGFDCRVV